MSNDTISDRYEIEENESEDEETEYYKSDDDKAENDTPENYGICIIKSASHFKTFDNKTYAIIGSCDYTLVSNCRNEDFDIQLKTALIQNNILIERISVTYHDKNVKLGKKYVKVNDRFIELPYRLQNIFKILKKNESIVVYLANGIKILWNETNLSVTAPKQLKNKLCGLCGNFDFESSNDLTTREGILVEDPSIFAQSWSAGEEICFNSRSLRTEICDRRRSKR